MSDLYEKCLKKYQQKKIKKCLKKYERRGVLKKSKNSIKNLNIPNACTNTIENQLTQSTKNFPPLKVTADEWPFAQTLKDQWNDPLVSCENVDQKYKPPDILQVHSKLLDCILKKLLDMKLDPAERRAQLAAKRAAQCAAKRAAKLASQNKSKSNKNKDNGGEDVGAVGDVGDDQEIAPEKYKYISPEFYLLLNKNPPEYDEFLTELNHGLSKNIIMDPNRLKYFLSAVQEYAVTNKVSDLFEKHRKQSLSKAEDKKLIDFVKLKTKELYDKMEAKNGKLSPLEMELLINDVEYALKSNKTGKRLPSISILLKKLKAMANSRDRLMRLAPEELEKLLKLVRHNLTDEQLTDRYLNPESMKKLRRELAKNEQETNNYRKYATLMKPNELREIFYLLKNNRHLSPSHMETLVKFYQYSATLNPKELAAYFDMLHKAMPFDENLIAKLKEKLLTTYTGLSNANTRDIFIALNNILTNANDSAPKSNFSKTKQYAEKNLSFDELKYIDEVQNLTEDIYEPIRPKQKVVHYSLHNQNEQINENKIFLSPVEVFYEEKGLDAFNRMAAAAKASRNARQKQLSSMYWDTAEKLASTVRLSDRAKFDLKKPKKGSVWDGQF